MRKVFALLLVMLACFTAFLAAETTELKLKVCRNDGQDYECLLSNVDNVKFIIGDKEMEDEADSRDYIEAGALTAASYKVSDSTRVFFSQGNLQFNAMLGTHQTADGTAQGTWRFAEKQYDVVGYTNENIDSTYFGWIDLFGWGTSGWNSGANAYQPWSKSESYSAYLQGGSLSNDLTGNYANADWGVYNAISNGGNEPNKWRTLTESELTYLFYHNKWTLGYIKTSEKDSVLCFMLLPKEFTEPEGVTVTVLYEFDYLSVPSTNTYSTEEFVSLEELGVVAFPCGGYRGPDGALAGNVGSYGTYCSSSARDNNNGIFGFGIDSTGVDLGSYGRFRGMSVRLVQDCANILFVNVDGTTLLDTVVERGVIPTYTREKPTMNSNKAYTFEYKGWNKKIVAAEYDTVYTAVYDSFPVLYTSVFKDYDGTTIKTIEKCTYDSVLAETPTRESIIQDYDYEFLEWKRDESKISDKQLVYTAVYSMKYIGEKSGVIQAAYKVSDTKSVYFSRGNLQYCAGNGTGHKTADGTIAQGTWRFAENQWDVAGEENANIDSTYTGWIDLFGWGTSGWNSKAICYQPWSKSETYSDYYPGGSYSNDLTGTYANADWGVYNAISNGGNEPNKWRNLTDLEWYYLIQNNKWTLGYINGGTNSYLCFMLIPETFEAPEGTSVEVLDPAYLTSTSMTILTVPSTNTYTTDEFASLEKLGVVALPCGGDRSGSSVYNVGSHGRYWSSSAIGSNLAYGFSFYSLIVYSYYYDLRDYGMSVRLVQDCADIHFVNPDGTTLLDTVVVRGATPTYTREEPTMDSTKAYTFGFKGWNKKVVAAECDMVYTAVYDSFPVLYTSVFKDYDGTTIKTIEKCTYDSVLAETPTRESIIQDYDYEFLEWKRDESKISDKQLVYTAVYRMKVAYKVSDSTSVYFSRGNLQYCAGNGTHKTADGKIAQGTWRFAENQWDVVGEGNANIDSTYTGWIDLFGWGTSGWSSKAPCYQPWSKSYTSSDYYSGGSSSNDLTGDYANADWGVYNAISNGGNEPNKWRTLTNAEWKYLFQNNKWTLGYIDDGTNSYLCFMLIPETFEAPEGTSVEVLGTANLTSTLKSDLTVPSTNTYTTDEFAALEKLGVVALPCGGDRIGASVSSVGSLGNYWSSSAYASYDAYVFYFYSSYVYSYYNSRRYSGRSVRLVQDVP